EAADTRAGDLDDEVADLDAGALRRGASGETRDHDVPFHFRRVQPQPGTRRALRVPELQQVFDDRLQQIDRHHHVALHVASAQLLLDQKRTYSEQASLAADQRRAAPVRMGWSSKQRLIEHVFPVAGEFALGDELRLERVLASAVAGDDDLVAD